MRLNVVTLLLALSLARVACGADTVPSDIQMPGTQPSEISTLESPDKCDNCHGGYNSAVEPAHNWRGSMMAQAGRDPIFWATLAIAEQDFDGSGDLCLRCHSTSGWLAGRSTPTDGSGLAAGDADGVECDYCHKLTNPNDLEHQGVMNGPFIANAGQGLGWYGSGMASLWSGADKLGPFNDADARHQFLQSDFHRDPAFCGTCHDVSNPAVGDLAHNHGALGDTADVVASGLPGGPVNGKAAFNNAPFRYGVVERTFSEHMSSPLSTIAVDDFPLIQDLPRGGALEAIYLATTANGTRSADYAAPHRERTYTCQTCHMRAVTGTGANKRGVPLRHDLPLHDMTGGNYWMSEAILYLDSLGKLRLGGGLAAETVVALQDGAVRAREQLQLAATLNVEGDRLEIVNHTGHKLITGYPEGRRMWLNVKWYDTVGALLREDGAYGDLQVDLNGAPLTVQSILDLQDPNLSVFEAHMGITREWANQLLALGYDPGTALAYDRIDGTPEMTLGAFAGGSAPSAETFHFVLNNTVVSDNRIPPFGMAHSEAVLRNATPVPDTQYRDSATDPVYDHYAEVPLNPPTGAVSARIDLLYQPTSWEYVQFLYLANDGGNAFLAEEGAKLLDAWLNTAMAAPFVMASTTWGGTPPGPGCELEAPTLLSATAGTNRVTLEWSAVSGAERYSLWYDQADKSQWIADSECAGADPCTFVDVGLSHTQSYCYKVTAVAAECESGPSEVLCATPLPAGQTALAGVEAIATGAVTTTGKGKDKVTQFQPATTFSAGDTVILRMQVTDAAGSPVPGAVVNLAVGGSVSAALASSASGADGIAEASWVTEPPRRNGTGGTPAGDYAITVTGIDAASHEWNGVETSTTVTIR